MHKSILTESSINIEKGSIALAELVSMKTAFDNLNNLNFKHTKITAFCDNKTVVDIANCILEAKGDLNRHALQLQQNLFHLRHKYYIQICWIPAHCNIHLHDRADFLATHAYTSNVTGILPGKVVHAQP